MCDAEREKGGKGGRERECATVNKHSVPPFPDAAHRMRINLKALSGCIFPEPRASRIRVRSHHSRVRHPTKLYTHTRKDWAQDVRTLGQVLSGPTFPEVCLYSRSARVCVARACAAHAHARAHQS